MIKYIKSLLLITSIFISFLAQANKEVEWQLGSHPELIKEAQTLLSSISKNTKTEHNVRQLLFKSEITLGEKKITNHISKIWYFNDATSMQDYGTDILYFDNLSEKLKVLEATTIKPSGELIQFDKSKVIINNSNTYDTFSNTKKVLIPFPSLAIGGIAIIDYIVEIDRDKLEGDWSRLFYPQNSYPRDKFELVVKSNSTTPFNWSSSSKYIKCEKANHKLECLGEIIPAERTDDNILWRDEIGQIVISESKNWKHVINVTKKAFNKSKIKMEGIETLLNQLTKNKRQTEEKIKAIHQFVVADIRYISNLKDGHSITPHYLSETIDNRYGDCKDKSALLIELLNRIGVKAYPVLVATNRSKPSILKTPAMTYFDHMVACFKINNKKMCLDPTDSNTGWRDTSSWIQGKVSLDLVENSVPTTIPAKKFRWEIDIKTDNVFLEDGKVNEKQKRIFYSEYASNVRGRLVGKSSKQLSRWAIEQYQSNISNEVEPIFKFSGINNINENMVITSATQFDLSLDINKKLSYRDSDYWLGYELDSFHIKNKEFPTYIAGMKVLSETTFDTSKFWVISDLFPEVNLQHRFGQLKRNMTFSDNFIHLFTRLEIPAQEVSIKDKKEFNKLLQIFKRESKISLFGTVKK